MLVLTQLAGSLLCGLAICIYTIAALAMNSYEVRRRLPYQSPFELWGRGCFCFYAGTALIITASVLKNCI